MGKVQRSGRRQKTRELGEWDGDFENDAASVARAWLPVELDDASAAEEAAALLNRELHLVHLAEAARMCRGHPRGQEHIARAPSLLHCSIHGPSHRQACQRGNLRQCYNGYGRQSPATLFAVRVWLRFGVSPDRDDSAGTLREQWPPWFTPSQCRRRRSRRFRPLIGLPSSSYSLSLLPTIHPRRVHHHHWVQTQGFVFSRLRLLGSRRAGHRVISVTAGRCPRLL